MLDVQKPLPLPKHLFDVGIGELQLTICLTFRNVTSLWTSLFLKSLQNYLSLFMWQSATTWMPSRRDPHPPTQALGLWFTTSWGLCGCWYESRPDHSIQYVFACVCVFLFSKLCVSNHIRVRTHFPFQNSTLAHTQISRLLCKFVRPYLTSEYK